MKKLGFPEVRGEFYLALREAYLASFLPTLANTFRSNSPSEIYRFLGRIPALRKWVGTRHKSKPRTNELTIVNDKFEGSTGVSRDDLRRDKTGQVRIAMSSLATRAVELPEKLVTNILLDNATAYDGTAMFADRSAVVTGGARDNRLSYVAASGDARDITSAEMAAAILDAIENIVGAMDDQGEPLNGSAKQFAVMFPTGYFGEVTAALADVFTSAGVSNTLKAVVAGGMSVVPVHNARLTAPVLATGSLFVVRTDYPVKALIWQEEQTPNFESLEDGSDHAFFNDEFLYGTSLSGNAAAGLPEMAAKVTFTNA